LSHHDDITRQIVIGEEADIKLVHIEVKRLQRRITEIEAELAVIKETLLKHLQEEITP